MQLNFSAGLTDLSTLQISHNKLTKLDDILHLIECTNISVLDLSHNHLEDPEIVEEVFAKMPSLVCIKFFITFL